MNQFKQFANGEVKLQILPGSPHCGIDAHELTLKYEIELTFAGIKGAR